MAPVCAGLLFLFHVAASAISPISLRQTDTANNHVVPAILPVNNTNDHAYWYRRLFGLELSARELECARNGTVLTEGEGEGEGAGCAWLLEQGPCAPSEWLVLEEGKGLRPACRPRPCAPGYALLAGERRCAPTHQLCAGGGDAPPALRYSLRGEARCHCKGFRALGPDARCHLLYARGACPEGQVLVAAFSRAAGACVAACERTPCADGEVRTQGRGGGGGDAPPRCEDFDQLDCASQLVPLFSPDVNVQVPVCDLAQRTLFATPRLAPRRRPRPERCLQDATGRCLEVVLLSTEPFAWRAQAAAAAPTPTPSPTATAGGALLPLATALLPLIFHR